MCGIHGVINLRSYSSIDCSNFVSDGFVAGSLRGMDSSGVFQIDNKYNPYMKKAAENGTTFIKNVKAQPFIKDAASALVTVCHVRAATRGKVVEANAHPFVVHTPDKKRLIGVHNGTLTFWEGKQKAKKVEVDSEWAMQHLADEKTDAFEDFAGAYAFVWWDEREPGKLQIARNSQRPLHFVVTKDKAQMYFASEAGMLAWLVDRHDIRVEQEVYSMEAGKLYTFDLEGKEIAFVKSNLPAFRSTYTPPAHTTTSYDQSRRWNAQTAAWENLETEWETEYDSDVWGGYYGRHANVQGYASRHDSDGVPETGLSTIRRIGDILSNARKDVNASGSTIIDAEVIKQDIQADNVVKMIDKVLTKARAEVEDDGDAALNGDDYRMPASFYRTSTATKAERDAAIAKGVMGELTWMEGVLYDPETCAIDGEIEDYVSGEGKVKYDAQLRNMTASKADRMYINNITKSGKSGDWVCIIGVNEDPTLKTPVFIVSELTATGKKKLHSKMN